MTKKEKTQKTVSHLAGISSSLLDLLERTGGGSENSGKLLFELGKISAELRLTLTELEILLRK